MPSRFDARFFLVEVPPGTRAEVWPGEAAEGSWVRPTDALTLWQEGRALLHPPNRHALNVLSRVRRTVDAVAWLASPTAADTRIEFQRGVRLVALRTPTLLPATHTNAWILGTGELLIVDPGAPDPAEIERLTSARPGAGRRGVPAAGGGADPSPPGPRERRAGGERAAGNPGVVPCADRRPAAVPRGPAAGGGRRAGAGRCAGDALARAPHARSRAGAHLAGRHGDPRRGGGGHGGGAGNDPHRPARGRHGRVPPAARAAPGPAGEGGVPGARAAAAGRAQRADGAAGPPRACASGGCRPR